METSSTLATRTTKKEEKKGREKQVRVYVGEGGGDGDV